MENQAVEVKVRYVNDTRKWEEMEVFDRVYSDELYNTVVNTLKNPNIAEVRWNFVGSSQGHYHNKSDNVSLYLGL